MPSGLNLVVIGGGSSYTPELIAGILRYANQIPVERLVLVDVPRGGERLKIIRQFVERMISRQGLTIRVDTTYHREEALRGADAVFSQIRVGGMTARARDERIPLKYGVIGQETVGPGGFANALRTIPVALAIAHDIERLCPGAWLLNFTNPSGMVTEAITRYSSVRTVGLCNVPYNIQRTIAEELRVDAERIYLEMYGLNHLSFVRSVYLDEQDITPVILSYLAKEGATGANTPHMPFSGRLFEALGLIPNDYLRYYWLRREMLRRQQEDLEAGQGTRAIQVMGLEADLYRRYQDPNLDALPPELQQRGGAYYSEVAVQVMMGLMGQGVRRMVVNVPNGTAIEGLSPGAVVEVSCRIDARGPHPVSIGPMDPLVRGLVQAVKAYEELTIEAAVHQDRGTALKALLANPLVPGVDIAEKLLDDILTENQSELPGGWVR
ncbi:MAG: 6-phospho-beta-glucosidase [Firmicutes bacterium]|nr:6-phospho-beta-glucosidase [Bacillota bacterium]